MFLKNSTLLKFTYPNKTLKNSKKLKNSEKMKNFWKIDKFWEKITWPHRSVRLLGFLVNGRKCSAILFFFSNKNFEICSFLAWFSVIDLPRENLIDAFFLSIASNAFSHTFLNMKFNDFFNFSLLQQPRIKHEKNA